MGKNAIFILVLSASMCACSTTATPPTMDLQTAALQGNVEEIRLHIQAGSDLNIRADDGATPLMIAATFGHVEVARALIEAGADLNRRNNDGSTALHNAAFLRHTEIVELLLDHGADKNARNNTGATALDSVAGPFEDLKPIYEFIEAILGPAGLRLDYERIKATRPIIAAMLR